MNNAMNERWLYVPESRLGGLQEKVEKLARRARKQGFAPAALKVGTPEYRKVRHSAEEDEFFASKVAFYPVVVEWQDIKISDFSVIGTLQTDSTGAVVIHRVRDDFDEALIETVRARVGECDHCKLTRRRTVTIVVRSNIDQSVLLVGRQCLADFVGKEYEHAFVACQRLLEILGCLDEEETWSCSNRVEGTHLDLRGLLAMTSAVIRAHGWVPKSQATPYADRPQDRVYSTANRVLGEHGQKPEPVEPGDFELADASISWAKSLSTDEVNGSDYLYNLREFAVAGAVTLRRASFAVSTVAAYQRVLAKAMEKAAEAKAGKASEYVGEIKKRFETVVTCLRTTTFENDFGFKTVHNFVDDNGNKLVWFATGNEPQFDLNKRYLVKLTVVKHRETEWKGEKSKETVVNRVAGIKELDDEAPEAH